MSRPTIPPIAIPLRPFRSLVYTTTKITAISSPDASISILNKRAENMNNLEY
jgi:hypothetical protein